MLKQKLSGMLRVSKENIDRVRSHIYKALKIQLVIPKSTLHKIVCKCLCPTPYKIQFLHEIKPKYKNKRLQIAVTRQN